MSRLYKWLRKYYSKTVNSIAFYPALISLGFLLLSILMLELDFSETGKHIKSQLSWLSLRDASTARSILTTISGGIISLTVFSFSMVMILLNQAASQMSNRMLDSMIGNRFQQIILGFYIGTIVYSLFLLSTIRDITSGIYVPALSIYLLLLFTVVDIFLFIYFLHYVTQSVKFEIIINRIHEKTLHTLRHHCCPEKASIFTPDEKKETLLRQKAIELLSQSDYKYLKLLAKPYVWAIRTEMMKGNIEAVNLYANDMVKEKSFQTITVVNEKGVVVSSTNKKLEGKPYASIGNAVYLSNDSTVVNKVDDTAFEVSSPVMGFNKRIGTLIFNYMPPKAELK